MASIRRRASGSAIIIQERKSTRIPFCARKPIARAFGGVPTGVAMPPMTAPKATPSTRAFRNGSPGFDETTTGWIMASMIAVAAVFEIQAYKKAVAAMKPRSTNNDRLPNNPRSRAAIRRFKREIAEALEG